MKRREVALATGMRGSAGERYFLHEPSLTGSVTKLLASVIELGKDLLAIAT